MSRLRRSTGFLLRHGEKTMIKVRREPKPHKTGILQILGIKEFRSYYLNFWVWFSGLLLSYITIIGALFWVDIFTVEGVAV